MPNWTYNHLTVRGDKTLLDRIEKEMKSSSEKEQVFDFNSVIPMPESLNLTAGSSNEIDIYYYLSNALALPLETVRKNPLSVLIKNPFSGDWLAEICRRVSKTIDEGNPPSYETGKTLCDNYINYGAITWYEWCCKNWGTKWNACDSDADRVSNEQLEYFFDTAWATPLAVIEAFSEKYGDAHVSLTFRNEDGYETIWTLEFENGEMISEYSEEDEDWLADCEAYGVEND